MKKLLSISLIMIIGFIAFSFATPKKTVDKPSEKKTTELTVEEDALYCSITLANGNSVSCWFCSCSDLAKTLQ